MTASQCQRIIERYGPYPKEIPRHIWDVYLGKRMGAHFHAYYSSDLAPAKIKDGDRMARLGLMHGCNIMMIQQRAANRQRSLSPKQQLS